MKDQLLAVTRKHVDDITALQRAVRVVSTPRIVKKPVLSSGAAAARQWFDNVRPMLEKAAFSPDAVESFSQRFDALLMMSSTRPMKSAYYPAITDLLGAYKTDIVHQIEIGSFSTITGLSISPYIEGLPADEGEYLDEAQRCLSANALRGCIVLGWCATIARIHDKIVDLGYEKFNKASEEMTAKTIGRYKPYSKKFSVGSLSELQRIFDTDILWVLEYLDLIDSNQHQRLRHCFEFRNNSAHPGLARITGENLYSFFSDVTQIVMKNPKFRITGEKLSEGESDA